MYQGAWVYPGLNPGYHSSLMNSSTGMTVAIASPRAGWTPMSRRFHCRFRPGNERVPQRGTPAAFRAGRTARYPGPTALPDVVGVPHATGCPGEPTMPGPEKPGTSPRPGRDPAHRSRTGTPRRSAHGERRTRGVSGSPGATSSGTLRTAAPGLLILDGHQFHRPSSTTVDGTSRVRTRKVSISTPNARPAPTSRNWVDPCWAPTMAKTENVPPSTSPADVTVVPVATRARLTASFRGRRCASSRILLITRML